MASGIARGHARTAAATRAFRNLAKSCPLEVKSCFMLRKLLKKLVKKCCSPPLFGLMLEYNKNEIPKHFLVQFCGVISVD